MRSAPRVGLNNGMIRAMRPVRLSPRPGHATPRRRDRAAWVRGAAFAAASAVSAEAHASAPTSDPNDVAPPLAAPNGQLPHDAQRWGPYSNDRSDRRRFGVTLQPAFAAWKTTLVGRSARPIRGAGIQADFDLQVWRTLSLRLSLSHTAHPVFAEFRLDEDEIVQTARSGVLQSTGLGLGAVYAFDLGRVRPTLEAGVGALLLRTPDAVVDGQTGGACIEDTTCDTGLRCGSDNVCSLAPLPVVHGGAALDVLLGHHWLVGAGLRYYALTSAPAQYPVYLTATARLGIRW